MPKRISMPSPTDDVEVLIRDESKDLDRKYRVQPLTRSKKRAFIELQERAQDIDPEDTSEAAESAGVRLLCDMLNVLVAGTVEDAPAAGDLLFDGWENETVTDDQIGKLLEQVVSGDPT